MMACPAVDSSFSPISQVALAGFSRQIVIVSRNTPEDLERIQTMNDWRPPETTPQASHPAGRNRGRRNMAIGTTAGLLGGGAIGLLIAMPSLTSAATDDTSTTATTEVVVQDDTGTATTDDSGTTNTTATDEVPEDRQARIREELQNLVDDGTITAEQADAVAADLAASIPGPGGHGPGGFGRHGHFGAAFDGEVLAGLLGIDVETLRTELRSGSTVAEIAAEQGVDVQTVIDALVAEAKSHLDLEVESGRLTQEEADTRLAEIEQGITDFVNNGFPARSADDASDDASSGA